MCYRKNTAVKSDLGQQVQFKHRDQSSLIEKVIMSQDLKEISNP